MFEDYVFLDIDRDKEDFYKHLTESHKVETTWIKRSVSNNYHIIMKDPCKVCEEYADNSFNGVRLFLNKGTNFSEVNWYNIKTEEMKVFPSNIIIHLVGTREKESVHYYITDFKTLEENIESINEENYDKLFYTFNLAITKDNEKISKIVVETGKNSSSDSSLNEIEIIEKYRLKEFKSVQTVYRVYLNFVKIIPDDFLFAKLSPSGIFFMDFVDSYIDDNFNGKMDCYIRELESYDDKTKKEWFFGLDMGCTMAVRTKVLIEHYEKTGHGWRADVGRHLVIKGEDIKKILEKYELV